MSLLRIVYLIVAIIGAIVPMYFFVSWFNDFGWDIVAMSEAWNVNDAASGLVWDLTISAVVLTIWILAEVTVRKDYWIAPICILATFCIGVSCGLPLYLLLRSRPRG